MISVCIAFPSAPDVGWWIKNLSGKPQRRNTMGKRPQEKGFGSLSTAIACSSYLAEVRNGKQGTLPYREMLVDKETTLLCTVSTTWGSLYTIKKSRLLLEFAIQTAHLRKRQGSPACVHHRHIDPQ